MTNIQVTYAAQTITSIEVAEMVGREHKNVMQDIRKISSDLGVLKIQHTLYFKETTYRALQAKQFEEAKFFLSIWEPSSSMRYDIAVHNRQLQLAVFNQTNS